MGPELALVLMVVQAAGSVVQGFQQAKNLRAQASVHAAEGEAARIRSESEAQQAEQDRRRFISAQIAEFATRGVDPSSGTPLEVIESSFYTLTRDVQNIRLGGEADKGAAEARAAFLRSDARAAIVSGFVGAAQSAGTTYSDKLFAPRPSPAPAPSPTPRGGRGGGGSSIPPLRL